MMFRSFHKKEMVPTGADRNTKTYLSSASVGRRDTTGGFV